MAGKRPHSGSKSDRFDGMSQEEYGLIYSVLMAATPHTFPLQLPFFVLHDCDYVCVNC